MKAKARRIIAMVLCAVMTFSILVVQSATLTVFAATVGEIYITDFPRSQDPNKSGWGHGELHLMNGWYMEPSSKMVLRALGSYNGPTCYCIEPGISQHTGDKLTQKGEDYWDYMPANETITRRDMQALIGRILQYGWTGNNSTSWVSTNSSDADKMGNAKATQILIHEVIVGERRADFSKVDARDYGRNNVAEQITSSSPIYEETMEHYHRIEEAVKKHTVRPDFGGTQFDFRYENGRYTVTLTDANNVLANYNFSSGSGNLSFSVSGNKLTITTDNPTDTTVTATKKESNRRAFAVWSDGVTSTSHSGNVQDVISYGQQVVDPVSATFSLRAPTGNLSLVKTSEDGKVANVPLHISGNGVDKDVRTGSDGTITVENLIAGTYTVTEQVDGYYVPQTAQTVTVLPGQTATVTFNNTLKRGSLTVTKTAEDGLLEGHRFHLYGTSDSGLAVNAFAETDSTGKATFENVLIGSGYTLEEVDTGVQYVIPDSQTSSIAWNTVTNASFENILKKFTVSVKKADSVTGAAQGDATLVGAVYGVYDGETLVDTYTTDETGSFTTKEYLCGDDWTLREITPSEGYLLDSTVHHIGAEPGHFTVEHNAVSMDVTEDVILGSIALIKHNDDGSTQIESPEVGAEFEVYLQSAGSYDAAEERERDLLVTDEDGFAKTKDLPYGTYTVHQTKGSEGVQLLPDFTVVVNRDGEVYRYLINNATFESYIKLVKEDAETGKTIPLAGAGFQLYDPDGELISMTFTYPTPTTISIFYTDDAGKLVTPEPLPYGKGYSAVEVSAPYGYVLDTTPVSFDVTPETMQEDGGITVVMVTKSDMAQKGTIDVTKLGEAFSSVSYDGTFYQPVYAMANSEGAEFEITAAEDIITPDGTLRAAKGTVVDTIVTGKGVTSSQPLYLGRYLVRETKAAYGQVLDPTVHEVTLSYAGQEVSVTSTAITITNQRQKIKIDLLKALEQDDLFGLGMNGEISNVQFALYAAEELTASDGSVIPEDGLLEILNVNEDGTAAFSTDLPVDAAVYIQEYSTDGHYILSDAKYPVTFEYAGQDTAEVHITINDGNAIENTLKRGSVMGLKLDEDGFRVGGVLFGLFPADAAEFTEETALMTCETNPIGVFLFENVPCGDYLVREIKTQPSFVLSSETFPVSVTEDGQVVEVTAVNEFITGSVRAVKVSGADHSQLLSGAVFEVYVDVDHNKEFDPEIDRLAGELSEVETGVYQLDGLRYNGYFLHEAEAPEGFIADDGYYYFEITADGETVTVENEAGVGFVNEAVPVVEIPKTSDNAGGAFLAAGLTAGVSAGTALVLLSLRRKRRQKAENAQ